MAAEGKWRVDGVQASLCRDNNRGVERQAEGRGQLNWSEFKLEAPDLAALGEERFESTDLVLVGTIKKGRVAANKPGGAAAIRGPALSWHDVAVAKGA